MNNEELYQKLKGQVVLSTAVLWIGIDGFAAILYSQIVENVSTELLAYFLFLMVLGYIIATIGFAMANDGFCRSVYESIGADFSAENEGDAA